MQLRVSEFKSTHRKKTRAIQLRPRLKDQRPEAARFIRNCCPVFKLGGELVILTHLKCWITHNGGLRLTLLI
ncbi:hypothetical protein, partial [Xanthomonas perforans]|uniref:hypothetical protein n=1 Tax=Xanthomonas perforans TaxID=442694 RepID=UPI001F4761EC